MRVTWKLDLALWCVAIWMNLPNDNARWDLNKLFASSNGIYGVYKPSGAALGRYSPGPSGL